jgi:hypothetical protein
MEKKYKIESPVSNIIIPVPDKKELTEKELREFVIQLISEMNKSTWELKMRNDPISSVIYWLELAGYKIKEI